jgi:hypothetical protein
LIPSLLAEEIRGAVVEYLTTTFALADDDARDALTRLLTDSASGMFRGPYLRVRTHYRPVPQSWRSPLGWLPPGFRPYRHQAAAFARLSSLDREPEPVIVTTGTGSGKTESFLLPILDHCRRHRGTPGVKALLLYPMNALASDQARRIAGHVHEHAALRGLTAGLYIGGPGSHDRMGPASLIDRRDILRDTPPDILLTNYKMLDYLLLREADSRLWDQARHTLRYLVLDEFHTYDGAQGTDVAMLLRRLGATLRVPAGGPPLGGVTPVATSATLGGSTEATGRRMREFAERVFGIAFEPSSVVGEERMTAEEAAAGDDVSLPIPDIAAVCATAEPTARDEDSWGELAKLFTGAQVSSPATLAAVLSRHPLTRIVADVLDHPLPLDLAITAVTRQVLPWAAAAECDPAAAGRALLRFLALLSRARSGAGGDGFTNPGGSGGDGFTNPAAPATARATTPKSPITAATLAPSPCCTSRYSSGCASYTASCAPWASGRSSPGGRTARLSFRVRGPATIWSPPRRTPRTLSGCRPPTAATAGGLAGPRSPVNWPARYAGTRSRCGGKAWPVRVGCGSSSPPPAASRTSGGWIRAPWR